MILKTIKAIIIILFLIATLPGLNNKERYKK